MVQFVWENLSSGVLQVLSEIIKKFNFFFEFEEISRCKLMLDINIVVVLLLNIYVSGWFQKVVWYILIVCYIRKFVYKCKKFFLCVFVFFCKGM